MRHSRTSPLATSMTCQPLFMPANHPSRACAVPSARPPKRAESMAPQKSRWKGNMELPTPKVGLGKRPPGGTGHAKGNGRQAALALLSEHTGSTTTDTSDRLCRGGYRSTRHQAESGALLASMHGARTAQGGAPQQRRADLRLAMTAAASRALEEALRSGCFGAPAAPFPFGDRPCAAPDKAAPPKGHAGVIRGQAPG